MNHSNRIGFFSIILLLINACSHVQQSVTLISPSFSPSQEERMNAARVTESMGLSIKEMDIDIDEKLCPEIRQTDLVFKQLLNALQDNELDMIWAVRGGRMALRLWPLLDQQAHLIPKAPPLLIGFSDITSLHLWLNERNIPTLHGPVLAYCEETKSTKGNLKTNINQLVHPILNGHKKQLLYTGISPVNASAQNIHTMSSILMGGNLSSIQYWQSVYGALKRPHILIIETVDAPTRILSILISLKLSGFFEKTEAILFGALHTLSPENPGFAETQARCDLLIDHFATLTSIPVFKTKAFKSQSSDLQFGHGDYNDPLPLGTSADLAKSGGVEFTLSVSSPLLRPHSGTK